MIKLVNQPPGSGMGFSALGAVLGGIVGKDYSSLLGPITGVYPDEEDRARRMRRMGKTPLLNPGGRGDGSWSSVAVARAAQLPEWGETPHDDGERGERPEWVQKLSDDALTRRLLESSARMDSWASGGALDLSHIHDDSGKGEQTIFTLMNEAKTRLFGNLKEVRT